MGDPKRITKPDGTVLELIETIPAEATGAQAFAGAIMAYDKPEDGDHRLVIEQGLDITRAFLKAGLSDNPELGVAEGVLDGALADLEAEDAVDLPGAGGQEDDRNLASPG